MGEIISVITGQAERAWGDRPGQTAIFGCGVVDHAHGFTLARLSCRIGQRATAVLPPGAIVWCGEVMIEICIRSTIWSSVFFNRIKQFRRIATRYEKLARNSLSFLNLVCTYFWQ